MTGSNGARRHRCLVCQRHFKRTEHLTRHLRRHTQEKPYQCQECLQCFARKELYQRHQQRFHGASQGHIPPPRVIPTLSCPPTQAAPPASVSGNSSHVLGSTASACNSTAGRTAAVDVPHDALPSVLLQLRDHHQAESTRAWSETPNEESDTNLAEPRHNSLDLASSEWSTIPSTVTTSENPDPVPSTISHPPNVDSCPISQSASAIDRGLTQHSPHYPPAIECLLTSPSSQDVTSIQHLREIVIRAINSSPSCASLHSPEEYFNVPDCITLDRYQQTFFALTYRNLPFVHASIPLIDRAPAVILSILADGAMHCVNDQIGHRLFEASRRLVSDYLDSNGSGPIPHWVIDTLLINCIYGLSGGAKATLNATQGSLSRVLWLASQVEPPEIRTAALGQSFAVEDEWKNFVVEESLKRSLLCLLIFLGLWSAIHGLLVKIPEGIFANLDLPCTESLWLETSAEQWKSLSYTLPRKLSYHSAIHELLCDKPFPSPDLASVCLVVGLILWSNESQESLPFYSYTQGDFRLAVCHWKRNVECQLHEKMSINLFALPITSYLRVELQVDLRAMMSSFLHHDFVQLRQKLRCGRLREACEEALHGLVPWAPSYKSQISMVFIPLSVIVLETMILLLERSEVRPSDDVLFEKIRASFRLSAYDMQVHLVWDRLKRVLAHSPATYVLSEALREYERANGLSGHARLSATSVAMMG
ncbi:hypothetical protein M431DRAFT_529849 [Trichoderma harzianum CBS 226.95]|uniref:C2H2-type domain-containing protein n=1 Tax=Trichoderma harzianum CBS 226.95 TaxID=983964 RepID=A0A2T4AJC7_TRIHA|nr:hypothetical protein M431DRAFT_529849 [Trichoderma harzianum CBS 226.95]PTB57166.1 hypothetical protein M431DRAFT_529849 [Trichoderma harzianum CBS 226.95]